MTVAQLIESLKDLPQDLEIQVMTSEGVGPMDIVDVSRGTWASELDLESVEDMIDPEDDEFIQDDEDGKIAVLVTW
jgi:uncharacterized protein YuzE